MVSESMEEINESYSMVAFDKVSRLSGQQHCCRNDGCPESFFVSNGSLCGIAGSVNLTGKTPYFTFFIPAAVRIKFNSQYGGKHLGREIFRIVPSLFGCLSKAMMFAQVAESFRIARGCHSDRGCDQAVGFIGGIWS